MARIASVVSLSFRQAKWLVENFALDGFSRQKPCLPMVGAVELQEGILLDSGAKVVHRAEDGWMLSCYSYDSNDGRVYTERDDWPGEKPEFA